MSDSPFFERVDRETQNLRDLIGSEDPSSEFVEFFELAHNLISLLQSGNGCIWFTKTGPTRAA